AKRNRRSGFEAPLTEDVGSEPAWVDFALVEDLHRVIGRLPAAYRSAVVAGDLQGLSRKEAAERLGWREGTLSGRLARARELLAGRLRGLGEAPPPAGLGA